MPEIVYMPLTAVVAVSGAPPPTGYAVTHTLARSAPLTAAFTVPEMLVLNDIAALTPVAGEMTVAATATLPTRDDAPVVVPLYHCVTKPPPHGPAENSTS